MSAAKVNVNLLSKSILLVSVSARSMRQSCATYASKIKYSKMANGRVTFTYQVQQVDVGDSPHPLVTRQRD